MIKGEVGYFGAATGAIRVVEAFTGAGFDQTPVARVKAVADGIYTILGLRPGTYQVRAFVDANTNGVLDAGEAWGFVKGQATSVSLLSRKAVAKGSEDSESPYAVEYSVRSIQVSAQGSVLGADLIAYDALAYHTNSVDSDGDGLTDDVELALGTNPLRWDSDFDGMSDAEEIAAKTDPTNPDSDGDGLPDGWEKANGLLPLSADGDDGAAGDPDHDGLSNADELAHGTLANVADTDGDGMPDGYEVTNNLDPLTNDAAADADNDGLTNYQEYLLGTDPNRSDTDDDELSDGQEAIYGTNPLKADTDGDGYNDGVEVAAGSDPLNKSSIPGVGKAQTEIRSIRRTGNVAIITYDIMSLTGTPAILDFMVNDDLSDEAGWTAIGVQRSITSVSAGLTNVITDPNSNGVINIRIRSK